MKCIRFEDGVSLQKQSASAVRCSPRSTLRGEKASQMGAAEGLPWRLSSGVGFCCRKGVRTASGPASKEAFPATLSPLPGMGGPSVSDSPSWWYQVVGDERG